MDNQERYERAKGKVKELKAFYTNLIAFVLVNGGLFFIDLLTSPGSWWFYWVTIFWGIGLVIHALTVFGGIQFLGADWEDKRIKEYMEKVR
jgi:hypothetical protein